MTELAYMTRDDWAQQATAMLPQSARIREWLGDAPYLLAVKDLKQFTSRANSLDADAAQYLVPSAVDRNAFQISQLNELVRDGDAIDHPVTVLHPWTEADCELLQEVINAELLAKVFVLVHHREQMVRVWLDGLGAMDLHSGTVVAPPDALMLEAARMIRDEEYNGLSSGHGKDAIVQLVRAFAREGYPADPESWLRAYFASGGSFRHAESISKLLTEMHRGVRHRVTPRYREEIVSILRDRVIQEADSASI